MRREGTSACAQILEKTRDLRAADSEREQGMCLPSRASNSSPRTARCRWWQSIAWGPVTARRATMQTIESGGRRWSGWADAEHHQWAATPTDSRPSRRRRCDRPGARRLALAARCINGQSSITAFARPRTPLAL